MNSSKVKKSYPLKKEKPEKLPTTGYIRLPLILSFIPLSPSTVWRKVKDGTFPRPIKLSKNTTAWKAENIHAWLDSLHAEVKP